MLGKTIRPQSSEIREKQTLNRRFDKKEKGQYCTVSARNVKISQTDLDS